MSRINEELSGIAHAWLVLHVCTVAAVCPLLDKFLTLERVLGLLTPRRPFGPYVGVSPDLIATVVHRSLRRPIHMRRRACLRLSLVLYHFLRLSGAEAVFHVAVFPPSTDPKRLHAHSWVTVGEVCLCEPATEEAVEILTYGPAAAPRLSSEKRHSLGAIDSGRRDASIREDWTQAGGRL